MYGKFYVKIFDMLSSIKQSRFYEMFRRVICPFKNLIRPYLLQKDGTYVYYKKFDTLYIGIAKNANSTINAGFLRALNIEPDPKDKAGKVHDLKMPFVTNKIGAFFSKAKLKITFVRNPFDRLVSCYVNKIQEENYWGIKKCYYGTFYNTMSFEEFANKVCKIPDFASDIHFRSQSSFLFFFGKALFNVLARVENLDEDYNKFLFKVGLPPKKAYNVSTSGDWRDYYNEGLARKVYKRYKKDFEKFGYENELNNLLLYLIDKNKKQKI